MKRIKIDFQQLIDGRYPLNVQLEVFNWMLKTGERHETRTGRWTVDGIDKAIYGYSANNHHSYTDFSKDFSRTLQIGFCNLIVKSPDQAVKKWRDSENVGLSKYRMLSFPEEYPQLNIYKHHWNLYGEIKRIYDYVGMPLKKKFFHPDYPKRRYPKILSIRFSTGGDGYTITFCFSFKFGKDGSGADDYEPGWDYSIGQKAGESIDMFIHRFHNRMKVLIQKK